MIKHFSSFCFFLC